MSQLNNRYVVVAGIDFSSSSEAVLETAFCFAQRYPGSELHAIAVATGSGDNLRLEPHDAKLSADAASKKLRDYAEQELGRLQKEPPVNLEHVVTHLGVGDPAAEITRLAAELDADLIVVGTHGHGGLKKLVLGSVADEVIRTAHAPVIIARTKDWSAHPAVPKIDPACPRCLEVRRESRGKELWCEQHTAVHGRRHTYHFSRTPGAHNSGFLIPKFKA